MCEGCCDNTKLTCIKNFGGNTTHVFLDNNAVCQCGEVDHSRKLDAPVGTLIGWICPACGKSNSPFIFQCACPGLIKTYTSGGTKNE
jgi:hypothetical protein